LTQSLGTSYAVTIPTLSDQASILDAFKYYHQGGLSGSPTSNSVEQHLINVNARASALETAIGWPYSAGSVDSRLTSLESTVGGSLSATYVKAIPSSNATAATRNLITPSTTSVIPLQVQGLVGQAANLQEWKTSAATVAYVSPTGRLYAHDGSATAEVATLSGTQTLTNKTLTDPFTTVGTNAKTASYTLVLTDQSKVVEINNASANTLTIPTNASVPFPVGTYILFIQTGAGQTTITPADGTVTINGTPGLKTRTQWSSATIMKRATNTWIVMGDVVA
jgi:hypothetical protein